MKKLYVTVTDDVYERLERYISFVSSKVIGISKSSVVNNALKEYFQVYYSGNSDDDSLISLDCIRSVGFKK